MVVIARTDRIFSDLDPLADPERLGLGLGEVVTRAQAFTNGLTREQIIGALPAINRLVDQGLFTIIEEIVPQEAQQGAPATDARQLFFALRVADENRAKQTGAKTDGELSPQSLLAIFALACIDEVLLVRRYYAAETESEREAIDPQLAREERFLRSPQYQFNAENIPRTSATSVQTHLNILLLEGMESVIYAELYDASAMERKVRAGARRAAKGRHQKQAPVKDKVSKAIQETYASWTSNASVITRHIMETVLSEDDLALFDDPHGTIYRWVRQELKRLR